MDPRIAARPPVACTGCNGQYTDRLHVDFNAAFEGPVLDPENPRTSRIDWLVLCEDCVRRAHTLLPDDDRAAEIDRLKHRCDQLEQRAVDAEQYADSLEDTLARRPETRKAEPKAPRQSGQRKSRYQQKAA